jgi:alcohol dehydrogenase class IV
MFAAASMGATAFQKGLGAIHSISHPVGARYDTHHGLTNAVVFPYVMICNKSAIEAKMDHVARVLNLPGQNLAGQGFAAVLAWILEFRKALGVPALGVPSSLAELGVREEDAKAIAADALADPTAGSNPRALSQSEFERLTLAAIRGDLGAWS